MLYFVLYFLIAAVVTLVMFMVSKDPLQIDLDYRRDIGFGFWICFIGVFWPIFLLYLVWLILSNYVMLRMSR